MAGTSEDITVRMKKSMLSWFGHVEIMSDERMVKKIYDRKVIQTKILEEGHVKSTRTPRRACMKRLMTVDETTAL